MKKNLLTISLLALMFFISFCSNTSDDISVISDTCKIFTTKLDLGDYYKFGARSEVEGNYSAALKSYTQAYEYGGVWDSPVMRIYSIAAISRIKIHLEKYSEAMESIKETEELNKEMNNFEIETLIHENYGRLYYRTEQLENSEIHFIKALNNYSECKVYPSVANVYNNLGLIYTITEHYKEAEDFLFKAVQLNAQLNRFYSQSANLTNLGILYKKMENYRDAEKAFLKSLEINKRERYTSLIGKDLFNLADLYYFAKDYANSLEYIDKSIVYVKSLTSPSTDYLFLAVKSCDYGISIAKEQLDKGLEENYIAKRKWFLKILGNRGEFVIGEDD